MKTAFNGIRDDLLRAGVRNLRQFGYSDVNKDNILTEEIFKRFFRSMLEDNIGKGNASHDREINALLKELGE